MKRFLAACLLLVVPSVSFAADAVTRRDGFLQIWEAIKRPAEPAKTTFSDVPEPAKGSLEIDYAKSRGIIRDEGTFRPDEPLTLGTALLWIFRTRNVTDDPAEVNPETMTGLLAHYPIAHYTEQAAEQTVTAEELMRLMNLLDTELRTEDHEVSLYSEKFHGKGTAFGETFDMYALTAAHRSFPSNTLVKVTNVSNGKYVIVRINDRGPYHPGRDMDLSLAAFTSIEDRSKGKLRATFERLGDFRLVEHGQELAVARVDPSNRVEIVTTISTATAFPPRAVDCSNETALMQRRIGGGLALENGVPTSLGLGDSVTLSAAKPFVVRNIRYPNGESNRIQDFVLKGEQFNFKPSIPGSYRFEIGTIGGRTKFLTMQAVQCAE